MPTSKKPRIARTIVPESYAWLARSHDIKRLWIVRMMVHFNAFAVFNVRYAASLPELHLPSPGKTELEKQTEDLATALRHMESRAKSFRLSKVLEANLDLLDRQFGLSRAERQVLAWAVLLVNDDMLYKVARCAEGVKGNARQFATILGLPVGQVEAALSTQGRLRKTGLIDVCEGGSPDHNVSLGISYLRRLASRRLDSVQEVFKEFLRPAPDTPLHRMDYDHLRPDFDFIVDMLREALGSKRAGVNILLHGSPGTGKTECARLLARELGTPLFEVSFLDTGGVPLDPLRRLQSAATAQYLLRDRRSLLLFDELDAAFNDGSDFTGKPTTAEAAKAWVNELLEKNQNPTIWTANRIDKMDAAFVRRFDLIIPVEAPPLRQRERLLEKLCGDTLNAGQIRRFAQVRSATPAVVTRAINVVRRVECVARPRAELLETVLDGTLTAQGHATVRCECRGVPAENYDVSLCNANADLKGIVEGLAKTGMGRICLYGPPGTGKTAFGHWLAKALDRPLILKRASDIESPFLGVMEKNLARAFEQAERDHAVLQIDEVDTFLQDRQGAQRQWEISQTNEFLTQLESFGSVFIASTNLMAGLDRAALRRFDYKIRVDYLRAEQARRMFEDLLHDWNLSRADEECLSRIVRMSRLTPGDFAVMRRRHAVVPFADARAILSALHQELEAKTDEARPIGFVC